METNFSRHTIADIRDWKNDNKLEIQPDFQRRAVWNQSARVMLIDSILNDIPVPKIFIGKVIKEDSTHRIVIDGQQRITSILDYLSNEFPLVSPYKGKYLGKYFNELDEVVQNKILNYSLDFNEFSNYTEKEIREIYNRVNKYTIALNKQELRRADFPGDFLDLSEYFATIEYFDDSKIFTAANRRRFGDVEYISELLLILIDGIQDKKGSLDKFYMELSSWNKRKMEKCKVRFINIINDLRIIFDEEDLPIKKTRFRQKSDFYSLFAAINKLHLEKRKLNEEAISSTRQDIDFLDGFIIPGATGYLGEYAVRCLSDANSISSRKWRTKFIANFLYGAYKPLVKISEERVKIFVDCIKGSDEGYHPGRVEPCIVCGKEVGEFKRDSSYCFHKNDSFLADSKLAHRKCLKRNNNKEFIFANVN